VMIEELAPHYGYAPESVRIEISGKRAGEKLYEELLTEDEALNVSETGDMFVVTAAKNRERKSLSPKKYRSDKDAVFLTKEEIRGMLKNNLPQDL
jgi:UDP-N-acetylglucosamine 4,6-dehydratase